MENSPHPCSVTAKGAVSMPATMIHNRTLQFDALNSDNHRRRLQHTSHRLVEGVVQLEHNFLDKIRKIFIFRPSNIYCPSDRCISKDDFRPQAARKLPDASKLQTHLCHFSTTPGFGGSATATLPYTNGFSICIPFVRRLLTFTYAIALCSVSCTSC